MSTGASASLVALDAREVFNIPLSAVALVALVCFIALTIVKHLGDYATIKRLQSALSFPNLTIDNHPSSGLVRLRLTNDGASATFLVQAITAEVPDAYWAVRWRGRVATDALTIRSGSHHLLELAEPAGMDGNTITCVRFPTCIHYEGLQWSVDEFTLAMPPDGFHIKVIVASDPDAKWGDRPALTKMYKLEQAEGQLRLEERPYEPGRFAR